MCFEPDFEPHPGFLAMYCLTICVSNANSNFKLTNKAVTNFAYASNELKEI